ncbi:MAG: Uma2 family endonuclease [Planctomycetota bacterium]
MTMTAPIPTPVAEPDIRDEIPPLENGDRLSRAEFERRYHAMPAEKKAELIEGTVYMSSPVSIRRHATPHAHLSGLLFHYVRRTPGVVLGDNGTVRLDLDNEPQPDLFLAIPAEAGGQAVIGDDDYLEGAPELVAEIAASSVSIDLNDKLHAYQRNGVREYVVWRTLDRVVDWFKLTDDVFRATTPDEQGVFRSSVFPGLALRPADLLERNLDAICELIDASVKTPEHAAFVKNLASASA